MADKMLHFFKNKERRFVELNTGITLLQLL
jgi:hypothetical protein